MSRYPANIITKSPATPTGPTSTGRAPGIWRMDEAAYWTKQGLWPNANLIPDQYFPYVTLLLSTTSLGNANNNLFVDSSGAFNIVNRGGSVPTIQGSFSPYGNNWSNYFDGNGDYLSTANSSINNLGSSDFTIELWFKSDTGTLNTHACLVASYSSPASGSWAFKASSGSTGYIQFASYGPSWNDWVTTTNIASDRLWHHCAVTRSGNTLRIFVDGTVRGTWDISGADPFTGGGHPLTTGFMAQDPTSYINGNISNVRIVKGTALYTSAFTPPTAPLTAISGTAYLTCQSNRFRDASTNNATVTSFGNTAVTEFSPFSPTYPGITYNQNDITNWSGYFDGSGDYLRVPSNAAFAFGTGDWTIEFWVYVTSTASNMAFVDFRTSAGSIAPMVWMTGGVVYYYTDYTNQITGSALPANTWTHIAVTRSGTSTKLFINGTQSGSTLSDSYNYVQSPVSIGSFGNTPTSFLAGYMSNVRIVKGTAVYTSNFTPPTTNLTAISGTSLLTLQNAAFTDNSTNSFAITQFGNVTVNGNNPFQVGYYSNYITPGNYLVTPSNAKFQFGTGDFTVEAWVNLTAYDASYTNVYSSSSNVGGSEGVALIISPSGALRIFSYVSTGYVATGGTVPLNQWVHVAMARQGTTLRLFLNGALSASVTNSENFLGFAEGGGIGGWGSNNGGSFTGYISNVRIVKGTAVYTAAFTPPTSPLTVISGTSLLACAARAYYIDLSNNFSVGVVSAVPPTNAYNPFYTSTTTSSGGSMYFSSTSTGALETILNVPASNTLDIGAGDFTLECWAYATSVQNYSRIINFNNTWASAGATNLLFDTAAQKITFAAYDLGGGLVAANNTYMLNTWYHIAVTRVGNVFSMYINGVKQTATYTTSSRLWATTTPFMSIGNGPTSVGGFSPMQGYVTDVRIIKGSAIYTANFTPPTAPLTPTANTTLLVNGMNAGAYDAAALNDMETVGNVQVSTVQSKFGGSSMYFDGSSDWLYIPSSQALLFTGSFTVEFWINFSDVRFNNVMIAGSSGNTQMYILTKSNYTGLRFGLTNGSEFATGSQTWVGGTWYHVALVRNGTDIRFYVDGVNVTDGTPAANSTVFSGAMNIGDNNTLFGVTAFNGYIDDLRITNGVARYTSNFTPPTAPFPPY